MLRIKRKKLMITQMKASEILGIDNTYLSLIENKKRCNINNDLINKICTLYKISMDDFMYFINKI